MVRKVLIVLLSVVFGASLAKGAGIFNQQTTARWDPSTFSFYLDNVRIGNRYYWLQWSLNPSNLKFELKNGGEITQESRNFVRVFDIFMKIYHPIQEDPGSLNLSDLDTSGCKEYYVAQNGKVISCTTNDNYYKLLRIGNVTYKNFKVPMYMHLGTIYTGKAVFKWPSSNDTMNEVVRTYGIAFYKAGNEYHELFFIEGRTPYIKHRVFDEGLNLMYTEVFKSNYSGNSTAEQQSPSTVVNGKTVTCASNCTDLFGGDISAIVQCETWQQNNCQE